MSAPSNVSEEPTKIVIPGYADEHMVGDEQCTEGLCGKPEFPFAGPFPQKCRCGGLVHANAVFSWIEHPYWEPDMLCDRCGDNLDAIDPLHEKLMAYFRRHNSEAT